LETNVENQSQLGNQQKWKPMLGTKVSLMETYGNQTKNGVSIFEQNHEDLWQILETKMLGTSNKS